MDETPDQLRHRVELARDRLGQNLNELQYSIRSLTDWRTHFRDRPWPILGAAFAFGLLAGLLVFIRD